MRDIEKYTENYNHPSFEDYQVIYRRKKILELMEKYCPKRILEIGCGMEPLFPYIRWKYEKYVIIEPSESFCKNAVNLARENERIVCLNDFFSPTDELSQNNFDFILCSSLLHEVEQPIKLLQDIATICNKYTIVHVNVPNANSFHRLIAKETGVITDVHEMSERNRLYQQHNVYDLKTLEDCVKLSGFRILEGGTYFIKPFTHNQMYEMVKENIINMDILDGLYKIEKYFPYNGSEIFMNIKIV